MFFDGGGVCTPRTPQLAGGIPPYPPPAGCCGGYPPRNPPREPVWGLRPLPARVGRDPQNTRSKTSRKPGIRGTPDFGFVLCFRFAVGGGFHPNVPRKRHESVYPPTRPMVGVIQGVQKS